MGDWKKGPIADKDKWKRGKVGDKGCSMNRSLNIPITDLEVWELVMDVVTNSAILKEGFKEEVLQSKFKGEEENQRLLRNEKKRTDRLMKELQQVQSGMADVETNKLLNKHDPAVYSKIMVKLDAELQNKKKQLDQARIRTKELSNQKSWLDWIGKYGEKLTLESEMPKEDKKEYLQGLLDRIEVELDKDTNDHTLKVFFRLGLVGDGIEYVSEGSKKDGYKVIEGRSDRSVVISRKNQLDRVKSRSSSLAERPKDTDKDGKKKNLKVPPKEFVPLRWSSLVR
jgi:hypothetical protein